LKHDSRQLSDHGDINSATWPFARSSNIPPPGADRSQRPRRAFFELRDAIETASFDGSAQLIKKQHAPLRLSGSGIDQAAPEYVLKRAFDIVGSLALLIFAGPLMAFIALLVWCSQGGPVLFRQERIGLNGRPFRIIKFRTMKVNADKSLNATLADNQALSNEWSNCQKMTLDPRVTRLGHVLRLSSVDELPQLFNVLKGEMSLVGPRPIVAEEAARYGHYFNQYCSVRPGLTGLWQVSGRNDTTYRRRVALDVCYSSRRSLGFDLLILFKTIPAVLTARGR